MLESLIHYKVMIPWGKKVSVSLTIILSFFATVNQEEFIAIMTGDI